ncbi:MAG: YicC family protein [Negativicutes bacterium]|nr:YicC family protein [Negativicutes bacterium]
MTGFGRGEYLDECHRFVVEIKAVNHRYNEIVIRMPKNFGSLEDKIRRMVSSQLIRGRIDIYITMDEYGEKRRLVRVDKELAMAYHKAIEDLAALLALNAETDNVFNIARYPDVLRVEEIAEDIAVLWGKLEKAIDIAVANLMEMRVSEGANLQRDLIARIDKLAAYVAMLEERGPKLYEEYRAKLFARMKELLNAVGSEPDESRLLQEAALYADRTNFTEELVRLRSHLAQFRDNLYSDAAVGRKLDFILQEINREANTIASKANDYTIANVIVEIKSEIEKVREQIQNIE